MTLDLFSKNPPDLKKELTSTRIRAMKIEAAGLKLLYATERVDQKILTALFDLAQEKNCVAQMKSMQKGDKLNTGEKRAVLHTAMRDIFGSPQAQEASDLAAAEIEKLKALLPKLDRFTTVVQIGIGGSSLGPEAIYLGMEAFSKRKAYFLSNVDPDDAHRILTHVDLAKTVFIVVSKSGTTLETETNEALVRAKLKEAGLNPKDHLIAVTGKGSPMDDPAKYCASFYIWDYIGGRYSVTSMVGGVLLALTAGIDNFIDFLKGAHAMDGVATLADPQKNLPLMGALLGIWNRNYLKHPTVAVIPYSQALARFPAHLQQLDMESNGKRVDKHGKPLSYETGPIVWGEPGTNGQHSFFQLIHQGTTVVPLEIIGFVECQYGDDLLVENSYSQEKLLSNLFAQAIGLAQGQENADPNKVFPGNRPSHVLIGERLTPFTLGALLAYYEHKVAFQGFIWGINSFDQEGVQLGKKIASKMIDTMVQERQGEKLGYELGEAYLAHLSIFDR